MNPKSSKKISRRDAIKLLGAAAGASVLANLPTKWKTPQIASGVLPAHAQTSSSLGLTITSCNLTVDLSTGAWSSAPQVGPMPIPAVVIPMRFTITFVNTHFVGGGVGPQNPNPYVGLWNLDTTTGTIAFVNNLNGALTNAGNMAIDAGAISGSVTILWEFVDPAHGSGSCSQTFNWALPTVSTTSIVDQDGSNLMQFIGEVTNDGGSPVTTRGFVWSTLSNPTLANNIVLNGSGVGTFTSTNVPTTGNVDIYVRAYATNAAGTAYGNELNAFNVVCLAEGSLITLADQSTKPIEEITYTDNLLVWNFDDGKFDTALPLWIKKKEVTTRYNLLEFSDGSSLKTINQHRIFNKELEAFTYPMTEDTPIGTTTFNIHGQEVTLIRKSIVTEQVNYYNVITDKHMNLFANGILTSCRYNNIYPIVDMKFVKEERTPIAQDVYGVDERYYQGLRLAEQVIPVEETVAYINRLKAREVETESVLV